MGDDRRTTADYMQRAAIDFLTSLNDEQRVVAAWPVTDQTERELWFYTPTDHGGLPLREMGPIQQQRAMQLLATGLSVPGYVTAATIMGLENILDLVEGWSRSWGRDRGRDPGLYYVRIFGDPSGTEPWSWRFGGHHVSVSHLVIDGEVQGSTPLFFGADPASAPLLGPHPLRPLAGVEDVARDLVHSLDAGQRALAIVSQVAPVDLVGANRPHIAREDGDLPLPLADVWRVPFTGELGTQVIDMQGVMERVAGTTPESLEAVRLTSVPRGISAGQLSGAQREILTALLDLYTQRLPEDLAGREVAKYGDPVSLDSLAFMWAGGIDPREPHYYRIQGPSLMCEYDNTQRDTNHVHSVWRDPRADFGRGPLEEHYARIAHQN